MRKRRNFAREVVEVQEVDGLTEIEWDVDLGDDLNDDELEVDDEEETEDDEVISNEELEEQELEELELEGLELEELDLEEQELEEEDPEEAEVSNESEKEDIEEAEFDLDDLIPAVSDTVNRTAKAGVLSVINSDNGKRVSISKGVHEKLGKPESVQIGFHEGSMIIGSFLDDEYTTYSLRKQGAKQIIYNKGLVEQIIENFDLDFSNCSSITFHSVTYKKLKGQIVAIIKL